MGVDAAEQLKRDEALMDAALAEARRAASLGEVPVGAVVVRDGTIIARGYNRREVDDDPSAHAEFSAVVDAARVLGRWRLQDCTVYVTLEPCCMCAGLMVNARVGRCVYGAADRKAGALGSLYRLNADDRLNHRFAVTAGVRAAACADVLRAFFADRRQKGSGEGEAIGASAPGGLETGGQAAGGRALSGRDVEDRLAVQVPRMLVAIDSYKGSTTSAQVESWAREGILRVFPSAQVTCLPLADGGEGTVDAVHAALGGRIVATEVHGPLGRPVSASYLLVDDRVAVVEMAAAAGITQTGGTHEDALRATTLGVGELVTHAIASGARTVYLGLGGSATNDGGAGFLQALGAKLANSAGAPIAPGLAGLKDLAAIDLAPVRERLAGTRVIALSDVRNPLVGTAGALRVFGPQKGLGRGHDGAGLDHTGPDSAGVDDVFARYDAWMIAYARLLDGARRAMAPASAREKPRFSAVASVPGAGAAGGLGAAVLSCGGELKSGVDAILDLLHFDDAVAQADVVVTGEGHMDGQSARGKAPVGVARRAKKAGKPVIALVGGRSEELGEVYRQGIDLVLPVTRAPMSLDVALEPDETRRNVICAGEAAARAFALGSLR